jgi:hypothetical protein
MGWENIQHTQPHKEKSKSNKRKKTKITKHYFDQLKNKETGRFN